ncbi:outer membrane beta-barrel protein [Turneriella parva]|uniref:Outer membrane protein beta-barrel domain-containing protein n=1 Tax=Turneriella parva (strain ATCC BAA-1111 / DSM 21527 / NCTC 11395 / H) TaxID=869212 RepID=I4BB02_TURPD|nr:outer membrane beta-barrel protein [Turneriella parva]AFM14459.1 hypothetical protein Turpa_3825 [Turneriella parva DSM 21527]
MKKIIFASALMLAATTSSFGAVKAGKFGMDFSFAGSLGTWTTRSMNDGPGAPNFGGMPTVGLRYHLTDMIAIAPSVGFYTATTTDNTNNTIATQTKTTEVSRTAWGFGLEIPLYLVKLNAMDLYIAPGVGFAPTSATTKTTRVDGLTTEGKSTGSYISVFAALGLQVPINDQFHVFGKTTVGWASGTTNPDTNSNPADVDDKSTYFGLQSWAVGAIFYFN